VLDKLKKEIEPTLKKEKSDALRYEKLSESENGLSLSELNAEYINQGWIEALEYVMGQIDHFSKEEYKSIQIPIGEEDIRMFEELVEGGDSFTWTFDKVNVGFIKDEGEE
tara:strand:+ start:2486 stop:2815 length:330 start_codon:yes stop_codon:yes gene_type:complete